VAAASSFQSFSHLIISFKNILREGLIPAERIYARCFDHGLTAKVC
jgi:hypothetical protein